MAKFEVVSRFKDSKIKLLPQRKTKNSAGYDLIVAEDIVLEEYQLLAGRLWSAYRDGTSKATPIVDLAEMARRTKTENIKPTLVSTGVKCYMDKHEYLEISLRSSTPLKYWIIMANSVGVIDADYVDNPDNEGEIFLQLINLSPFPIQLKAGDCIGQAILHKFEITENDNAEGARIGGFGSTSK